MARVPHDTSEADPGSFGSTARFVQRGILGRGAMGLVYRVHDLETDTEVALKTLTVGDPELLFRLKQEFRLLSDIVHPNLVELYELVVGPEGAFFTMEIIEGSPFTEWARGDGARGAHERFREGVVQLACGLEAVHLRGKLHRDVKPSNVLVSREGRVVLLDFGLATALGVDGAPRGSREVDGTFAYMAPEAVWGAPPAASADWYSVGVLLYEALAGRLPFDGPLADMFTAKDRGRVTPLRTISPHVPVQVAEVVESLLDPRPDKRPCAPDILAALGTSAKRVRTVGQPRGAFVGRSQELALLQDAYEETRAGTCAVVQVRGPSGIGKTELVRRFLAGIASDDDAVVLPGRCNPHESVPFKALDRVIDALSRHVLAAPDAWVETVVPRHAGALSRLFPVLACIPRFASRSGDEDLDPLGLRRRAFGALRDLLERVAATRRVVVWIDDAQWSDPDSIALLGEILADPLPPSLMLVLSYRFGDDGREPPVARRIADDGAMPDRGARIVDVRPLSDRDAAELARQLCAMDDAQSWLGGIVTEAAGNPFVVVEIARALRDSVRPASSRFEDVFAGRLEQLAPPARRLLEVVSVAGQPLERGVMLDASGLGEKGRSIVAGLERLSLVRTAPHRDGLAVDTYHDRIREAVLTSVPADQSRFWHGQIADTLERRPEPDPASLLHHLRKADRPLAAAVWAGRAGDRAAAAMAFADAAGFYEEAMALREWDEATQRSLAVRRADALVNAGHCAAAAPLYLTAAEGARTEEGFDLRRRAAGQLLISGRIDEGTEQLRRLLADLGLRFPVTARGARMAALGSAVKLLRRWHAVDGGRREGIPSLELTRVDTCHFAAKGLLAVDPARGVYFSLLALVLSIATGDRERIGRDLATLGALLVVAPHPIARAGHAMIARADAMSRELSVPHLTGNVMLAVATTKLMNGLWQDMLDSCDSSVRLFRDHCHGVTLELNLARMIAIRALEELGRLHEVRDRTAELGREGAALGDLYAQVTARLNAAFWKLGAGDPVGARADTRSTMAEWARRTTSMQHFYALRIEVCCDVYEGAPAEGLRRLDDAWPGIRRSQLLLDPIVRADALGLRARTQLAVAHSLGDPGRLRGVRRDRRVLEGLGRADSIGDALVLRAGEASLLGEKAEARSSLLKALATYDAAGMQLDVLYARRRLAQLHPEDHGPDEVRLVDEALRVLGIGSPEVWLGVQAPGFHG